MNDETKRLRKRVKKLKVEGGNRKLQNQVRVERIRPSRSRSVATAHDWTNEISLGSKSRRCGWLTAHGWTGLTWHLAAAGHDFTWQQQIVISAAGSNRLRLVVAGCRLAGCGLAAALFNCLCLCLWFVKLWLTACVCVRFASLRVNCWVQCVCVLCTCSVCVCCAVCTCSVCVTVSVCVLCSSWLVCVVRMWLCVCVWLSGCVCVLCRVDKRM